MNEAELALSTLNPLIDQAKKEGKLLQSNYQCVIFFPSELRKQNEKGSFIWGAVNWKLIEMKDETQYLRVKVEKAKKELEDWELRVKENEKS